MFTRLATRFNVRASHFVPRGVGAQRFFGHLRGDMTKDVIIPTDLGGEPGEKLTIAAEYRYQTGKYIAKWLRMHGRVPGLVFSYANQHKEILSFDDEAMVHFFRQERHWLKNTIYRLVVNESEERPAGVERLPRLEMDVICKQVFLHQGRRDAMMNLILHEYIPGKRYPIHLPVRFTGLEDCKGSKDGGVFLIGQDHIPCYWVGKPGQPIPKDIECSLVDVQKGTGVRLSDLPKLPEGLTFRPAICGPDPLLCHIGSSGGEVNYTWKIGEDKKAFDPRSLLKNQDNTTFNENW